MAGQSYIIYGSIAAFDAYWAAHSNPSTWTSATVDQKTEAALQASEFLDFTYGRLFPGRRSDPVTLQPRQWPRDGAYNADGDVIEGIPPVVCDAVAYLAHAYILGDRFLPDMAPGTGGGGGALIEDTVVAGPIRLTQRFSQDAPGTVGGVKTYPLVENMLLSSGILSRGGEMERG